MDTKKYTRIRYTNQKYSKFIEADLIDFNQN